MFTRLYVSLSLPHLLPHLQYNIPFLDVAVSGCQALGGNVLDEDVAG